jgi:hypothetical protein
MSVETDITLPGEPPMPIAAIHFGIAEVLTNAVRHSGADKVQIGIGYAGGLLRATIADDGILAVSSAPGGPTIIAMEVPCELSSTDAARAKRFPWSEKTLVDRC